MQVSRVHWTKIREKSTPKVLGPAREAMTAIVRKDCVFVATIKRDFQGKVPLLQELFRSYSTTDATVAAERRLRLRSFCSQVKFKTMGCDIELSKKAPASGLKCIIDRPVTSHK